MLLRMAGSRKYSLPIPQGRLTEFPRGRGGFLKSNFLMESMMLNWNFQRGGRGSNKNNLPWGRGGIDIFWNNTIKD